MTTRCQSANAVVAQHAVGDLVWVRMGTKETHEEPATVLKVGCPVPIHTDNEADEDEGIMVRINVSFHERLVRPEEIRSFDMSARLRRRSSPRMVFPPLVCSSSAAATLATTATAATAAIATADVDTERGASRNLDTKSTKNKKQKKTSKILIHPPKRKQPSTPTKPIAQTNANKRNKTKSTETKIKSPYFDKQTKIKEEPELAAVTTTAKKRTKSILKSKPKLSNQGKTIADTAAIPAKPKTVARPKSKIVVAPVKKQVKSEKVTTATTSTTTTVPAVSKPKAKPKPKINDNVQNALILASDNSTNDDDDEQLDRPFQIEYSPSCRAACKRCDEKILKQELRISHRPLFRGKPGFQIYRHLHCCVFSSDIHRAEDVGGYSKLTQEDFVQLALRVEESKEELEQENKALDPDELAPQEFQGDLRSSPMGLAAKLLPFQVTGVSWMYQQEVVGRNIDASSIRGGILADEMGMGKTLQSIVTILDNRPMLQHTQTGAKHPPCATEENRQKRIAEDKLWSESMSDWNHEMEMNDVSKSMHPTRTLSRAATRKGKGGTQQPSSSEAGARAGTLVICPVIALTQWKSEIEKFSEQGSLTVCTYHGPNRSSDTPREMLRKYDIVLTTYQVMEADFRKMVSPNKVKCPNCGGKYKVDKLRVHLKYFCGEGAQRTEAQARQRSNREGGEGPNSNNDNSNNGGENKKGGKHQTAKKKAFTRMAAGASKKSPSNKTNLRVKGSREYDSESDLSINDEPSSTLTGRPSRSAAAAATKRLSASKKEWGNNPLENDSDDYEQESDDNSNRSDDDDNREIETDMCKSDSRRGRTPSISPSSRKDDDSDSDSWGIEQNDALKRVREKQRQAIKHASSTRGKKKGNTKKKLSPKGKGKGKAKGTNQKKKEFKYSDSDSDTSDESGGDKERDPLEGIDMDQLIQDAMAGSIMSVLHSLCWWRIILDEAHMIKSRSSQTASAAFSLIGIHRWCLSGTPLQNRVGEFYSLIRFLRINPMAHYFCRAKGCDCKSLHYRMMNGRCKGCGHGSVQHFSHFNKHVLNPIQRDGYCGDGRRAMFKLKDEVLDKFLLRRTKDTNAEDMNLPPRVVSIRTVRLHPIEEDFYNALYTQTQSSFSDYVADGTLLNNYAHIFDLLMRMRQAVDHPYLVVYSKKGKVASTNGPAIANGSTDCDICHGPPTERVVSSCCSAAFCRSCVLEYMSASLGADSTPCPSCQNPFSIDLNQVSSAIVDDSTLDVKGQKKGESASSEGMPSLKELPHVATGSILRRINLAEYATSTKIEALTEELVRMRQTSPGSKAIVFSQFVNMLDLIRWRLHSDPCLSKMGLQGTAIHGSMNVKSRDASLKAFREDPNVRVLLISLKAGGVALNLTVANYIYLMDPWWNPAAEMQAIDRTHRLGQYRPIRAVRFIAQNTVEERILQLQEKKRLVFDGTVGRDAGSLKMLTVDDMKSLFT